MDSDKSQLVIAHRNDYLGRAVVTQVEFVSETLPDLVREFRYFLLGLTYSEEQVDAYIPEPEDM